MKKKKVGLGLANLWFLCQFASSVTNDLLHYCCIDVSNHLGNNVLSIQGVLGDWSFMEGSCGLSFCLRSLGWGCFLSRSEAVTVVGEFGAEVEAIFLVSILITGVLLVEKGAKMGRRWS